MARQWYILDGNEKKGPLAWQELCRQARSGALRPEQLVWTKGLAEWTPGRDVQGLFAAPPPSPVPTPKAAPAPPPPPAPAPAPTVRPSPAPASGPPQHTAPPPAAQGAHPSPPPAAAPSTATPHTPGQHQRTETPSDLAKPLRVSQYLGFYATFVIPPLGILLTLFWAVSPKCNPNLRNLARAVIVISILVIAVFWILMRSGYYATL